MPLLSRLLPSSLSSAPQEPSSRTLELTINSLQEQLFESRSRWQAERKEWLDECETVMACHRIAHLKTNVLLAQERVVIEHERDLTRKERVAVIQRDFNLILSKAREKELSIELKDNAYLLRDAEKAKDTAELQSNHMQAELAALQVQLSSANSNVDRLTSSLEDVQTDLAEKEQLNDELQQETAALKVQVGKRKLPDEKGGAEVEELQKQCALLDSQIKHLESLVTEEQNKASTHEVALQKERKNTKRLQLALEEQADKSAQADEESNLLEQQSQHYKDELEKALRHIKQLKAGSQTDDPTSRSQVHDDGRADDVETTNPPESKSTQSGVKSKKTTKKPNIGKDVSVRKPSLPTNKGKRKAPQDDEDTTVGSVSEDKAAKSTKSNSEKGKTKSKTPAAVDVDDETNDVAMPRKKKMRKLNLANPLFASAQPNSLDWANQFNVGDSGLDIPTELSPVKVPARSLAGKSASASLWKNSSR